MAQNLERVMFHRPPGSRFCPAFNGGASGVPVGLLAGCYKVLGSDPATRLLRNEWLRFDDS